MTCIRPVWIKLVDQYVPCGRCVACKVAHSREWATRLMHEAHMHDRSVYLTLTLDDERITDDMASNLRVAELQQFFRRLRKKLSPHRIKYYACGEYGEKNGRAHYHAIVFGIGMSPAERRLITDVWGLGNVHFGMVEYDSCRYVADYIMKKYNGKVQQEKYGNKQQPFQLSSNGLGLEFIKKYGEQLKANLTVLVKGKQTGLPRYYVEKLGIDKKLLKNKVIESNKKIFDDLDVLIKKAGLVYEGDITNFILKKLDDSAIQRHKNIIAQKTMRNRRF